jgi:hypothetical protein
MMLMGARPRQNQILRRPLKTVLDTVTRNKHFWDQNAVLVARNGFLEFF